MKAKICKKVCNACPFSKTSIAGFLADYTIQDFVNFQSAELMFPCHKHVPEDGLPASVSQLMVEAGKIPICRGYIESMVKSGKLPRVQWQKDLLDSVRNEMSEESMSIFEFVKHHEVKL